MPPSAVGTACLAAMILVMLGAGCAGQQRPIFEDRFRTAALEPGWSVDASDGNRVAVKEGAVEIEAAENTFAHIERRLDADFVRASCAIQAGSGISWCTSLFLYWKPGDWCQMGVIPRGGGRYYFCLTSEGRREEQDLAPCRLDAWHSVALELAEDGIRLLSSDDGRTWRTQTLLPRPASLQGPPALLVVGKGFGLDASRPDLDVDYGERGPVAVSRVRDVLVVPVDPARRRITAEERRRQQAADADPMGSDILAARADPSYEAVAPVCPPLAKPREAVGVKDHPYEIGVEYDGTIQIGDHTDLWEQTGATAFFEVATPPVRFGSTGCTKRLLDGYLPVVVAQFQHDGMAYEETVFGHSEGMSPDKDLWGYVRLRISNPTKRERAAQVALRSAPADAAGALAPRAIPVPAEGSRDVCFKVPIPREGRAASEIGSPEFQGRLEEVRGHWARLLGAGMRVTTPEARVNDACRAWLAYNFIDVDKKGDRYEPHDGAGFYEEVFGYSAVVYCHALDLWGYHEDSRRYLESLLGSLKPDGLFFVRYGLPDHGAMLLALSEHYRMTGDEAWLRRTAPTMIRMCDWIVARRQASMAAFGPANPLTRGLIRFTPYADYGEATVDYYGDAYCCVGLESAAEVLRRIGASAEADRLAREAAAYRACILASMDAAVIERDGMKILPMEPDTHRLLKGSGYKGGGYYGLIASMMLESGLLPASDPRARWVTDAIERRGGLVLGMVEFDRGVDHAYTFGYWMNCLGRDEVRRVLLGFYATLAYGMGRDTYGGVEVTQVLTGEPTPTMPHLYSGTQQLRLLRMMLLREEGQDLLIGQAMPQAWLAAGKQVEVIRAPTAFGPVSFTVRSEVDRGRILVSIDPPSRRPPASIRVRLRHPEALPIRGATVNGAPAEVVALDTVRLAPAAGPMNVVVTYR